MEEKKRWSVTFTKHIKQKRKVYHDGFLNFDITSKKLMLYDESESLLEKRILKKDEIVRFGETLTFSAYLVDVGDQMGDPKASSESNPRASDHRFNHKSYSSFRPQFKSSLASHEEHMPSLEKKMPMKSLSPSQKIIRVFKKREMQKYRAPQSNPQTPKTSVTDQVAFSSVDKVAELNKTTPSIKHSADEKCQNQTYRREHTNTKPSPTEVSKSISSSKPLRDTNQILSILQNPEVGEGTRDKNFERRIAPSPSLRDQIRDSDAIDENVCEDGHFQEGTVPRDGQNKLPGTGELGASTRIEESPRLASSIEINSNSRSMLDGGSTDTCQVLTPVGGSIASCMPLQNSESDHQAFCDDRPSFDLGI